MEQKVKRSSSQLDIEQALDDIFQSHMGVPDLNLNLAARYLPFMLSQYFCQDEHWPPLEAFRLKTVHVSQSCAKSVRFFGDILEGPAIPSVSNEAGKWRVSIVTDGLKMMNRDLDEFEPLDIALDEIVPPIVEAIKYLREQRDNDAK